MNTKYVYSAVLLVVLIAWFGHSTTKTPLSSTPQEGNSQYVVAQIVGDPATLGIKFREWSSGGQCNIESINGMPMTVQAHNLVRSTPLRLTGWAMDIDKERLPESVIIRFEGKNNNSFYAPAITGLDRADVRDYFSVVESLVASGYETNIDLGDLPDGEYALTLIMKFIDAVYVCDNGRKIIVQ